MPGDAVKCSHCDEFPEETPGLKMPWHFRTPVVVIALCSVGPLALPMIWWHPKLSPAWKIGLTVGIGLFSWALYRVTMRSVENLKEIMELMQ